MVASSGQADNALQRFVSLLAPGTPLGDLSDARLPKVDFATWYAVAVASMGAVVGGGELDFPIQTAERVAMQLELLREVARDPQGIRGFGFIFLRGDWDQRARAFAVEIVAPFFNEWLSVVRTSIEGEDATEKPPADATLSPGDHTLIFASAPFVNPYRIDELRALRANRPALDVAKLIRLCEELNAAWSSGSYFAVAMLCRAVMDHVPPAFGVTTFAEVANNVASAERSFKNSMEYLQKGAREISNLHLHVPMRKSESLPNATQVFFAREIDLLLGDVVRRLKS
jgi:hypothetical protein